VSDSQATERAGRWLLQGYKTIIAEEEEFKVFQKILYPTDFSSVSKKALGYIKQLKESGAMEVIVLHVIEEGEIAAVTRHLPRISVDLEKNMRESAMDSMSLVQQDLEANGLTVDPRIKTGIPLREILKVDENEDISLIVIGSHGKSNLQEIFLGSVSEKVIRKCKKPVLVIKR